MKIERIVVGELEENCYILKSKNKGILVDPGDEYLKIEQNVDDIEIVGIFLTHAHFDHIGALSYFENKYHLKHNERVEGFLYKVLKTPGHSKDSLTFYFPKEKIMFTGDFIFQSAIGRMDLPGGSKNEMKESLKKILKYPDEIKIYPGHGPSSTLKQEKEMVQYYFNHL